MAQVIHEYKAVMVKNISSDSLKKVFVQLVLLVLLVQSAN